MSNIVAVTAVFPSGSKHYSYFVGDPLYPVSAAFPIIPEVDDFILTSFNGPATASPPRGFTRQGVDDASEREILFARIVEVHMVAPPEATKPYIMLLKRNWLVLGMQRRVEFGKKLKAKAEARKKLEAMVQQEAMMEVYRKLAESNPEAASLLRIIND